MGWPEIIRSLKVQDAKRRLWESYARLTDEEMASLYFAFVQLCDEEDLWEGEALFGAGWPQQSGWKKGQGLGGRDSVRPVGRRR